MAEVSGLAVSSLQEPSLTEPSGENADPSLEEPSGGLEEEPWRVLPDADVEIPGDRLDKRGNQGEGPGVFRCHCLDTFGIEGSAERIEKCFNDFQWGASYRNVQSTLSVLIQDEKSIWKAAGHHQAGEKPALTMPSVPMLPELTFAMGAGSSWVQPDKQDGEEDADDGEEKKPSEWFVECAVPEPHDVADYLRRYFSTCGPLRLLIFQTREGATLLDTRTSLLGKESTYEIWPREPGTYEIGSLEAAAEAMRFRELIAGHLLNAQKPVLIDDSVNSYLVVGYREFDPDGPNEESPVQYRILDAQYGVRYAVRKYNFIFDPEKGPDQLGTDIAKDQWVPAEWLEEGRGCHNMYIPGPMWMVLLIGDYESSANAVIDAHEAAEQAAHDAKEEARKENLAQHMAEEAALSAKLLVEARLLAEQEETGDVEGDEDDPPPE